MPQAAPSALDLYMDRLRQLPPLDREEEDRLARVYRKTRDPAAGRRLVEGSLPLVVKMACDCARSDDERLELIQEGNLGLMKALERHDPARGARFATYATWWIRAYMLGSMTQARAETLEVSLALPPSADTDRTWADVLPDETALPDIAAEDRQLSVTIQAALRIFGDTLQDDRDRAILHGRWLVEEPESLEDIGSRYGTTRQTVRRLEVQLLRRLRAYLVLALGDAVPVPVEEDMDLGEKDEAWVRGALRRLRRRRLGCRSAGRVAA